MFTLHFATWPDIRNSKP